MIAVINLRLIKGMFMGPQHLRDLAAAIFQNEVLPERLSRSPGIQLYTEEMVKSSIYTCAPAPASQASFLWLTEWELEIVIQTFYQGHLIRYAKKITETFLRRLEQINFIAEYNISLRAQDAQTYITGEPVRMGPLFWEGLKDNLTGIAISLIMVVIAKVWLPNYFQEALAIVIYLFFFTLWETLYIWWKGRKRTITWRIHE